VSNSSSRALTFRTAETFASCRCIPVFVKTLLDTFQRQMDSIAYIMRLCDLLREHKPSCLHRTRKIYNNRSPVIGTSTIWIGHTFMTMLTKKWPSCVGLLISPTMIRFILVQVRDTMYCYGQCCNSKPSRIVKGRLGFPSGMRHLTMTRK
jgi:hypothetical protein